MDITYQLQGLDFEWDESEPALNLEKHGITFEEAAETFSDPFYKSVMHLRSSKRGIS